MDKLSFILWQAWLGFVGMIWYRRTLFRPILGLSAGLSKALLWICVILSCTLFTFVYNEKHYTYTGIAKSLIVGFGIYTVAAYVKAKPFFICGTLLIFALISAVDIIVIMSKKIKNKRNYKKILTKRIIRCIIDTQLLFSVGFAIIVITLGKGTLFGGMIISANKSRVSYSAVNEQLMEKNAEMLLKFRKENWEKLSIQEKLDALQVISDIEAEYLGLPYKIDVGAGNATYMTLAFYNDNNYEIVVNIDDLFKRSSWTLLNAICHEVYHSYQYRMLDIYHSADDSLKGMRFFGNTASYAEEFSNYTHPEKDIVKYTNQVCENTAKAYANIREKTYRSMIEEPEY